MEIKHVVQMLQELSSKRFYGTLQIEFRAGRPYLGLRTEKVVFDRPMTEPLQVSPTGFSEALMKHIG